MKKITLKNLILILAVLIFNQSIAQQFPVTGASVLTGTTALPKTKIETIGFSTINGTQTDLVIAAEETGNIELYQTTAGLTGASPATYTGASIFTITGATNPHMVKTYLNNTPNSGIGAIYVVYENTAPAEIRYNEYSYNAGIVTFVGTKIIAGSSGGINPRINIYGPTIVYEDPIAHDIIYTSFALDPSGSLVQVDQSIKALLASNTNNPGARWDMSVNSSKLTPDPGYLFVEDFSRPDIANSDVISFVAYNSINLKEYVNVIRLRHARKGNYWNTSGTAFNQMNYRDILIHDMTDEVAPGSLFYPKISAQGTGDENYFPVCLSNYGVVYEDISSPIYEVKFFGRSLDMTSYFNAGFAAISSSIVVNGEWNAICYPCFLAIFNTINPCANVVPTTVINSGLTASSTYKGVNFKHATYAGVVNFPEASNTISNNFMCDNVSSVINPGTLDLTNIVSGKVTTPGANTFNGFHYALNQITGPVIIASSLETFNESAYIDCSISVMSTTGNNIIIKHKELDASNKLKSAQTQNKLTKIYPNPVSDKLIIEIPTNKDENIQYKISDITGKVLLDGNYSNTGNYSLNLNTLSKGSYFINLKANGLNLTEKLVK